MTTAGRSGRRSRSGSARAAEPYREGRIVGEVAGSWPTGGVREAAVCRALPGQADGGAAAGGGMTETGISICGRECAGVMSVGTRDVRRARAISCDALPRRSAVASRPWRWER